MKKKIAICLYGLPEVDGKYGYGNIRNLRRNYDSFKKNIVDFNEPIEMDIYIHTWAHKFEDQLNYLYNPKKIQVEKNNFEISYEQLKRMNYGWGWYVGFCKSLLTSVFDGRGIKSSLILGRIHSILSRWKSVKSVLNLCSNEEYDAYVLARLDLYYIRPIEIFKMDLDKLHMAVMNSYFHDRKIKNHIDMDDIGISHGKLSDIFQISTKLDAYKLTDLYEKIKNGVENLSPHVAIFNVYRNNLEARSICFDIHSGYHVCIGRDFKDESQIPE